MNLGFDEGSNIDEKPRKKNSLGFQSQDTMLAKPDSKKALAKSRDLKATLSLTNNKQSGSFLLSNEISNLNGEDQSIKSI